jgi:hypothetical protein
LQLAVKQSASAAEQKSVAVRIVVPLSVIMESVHSCDGVPRLHRRGSQPCSSIRSL